MTFEGHAAGTNADRGTVTGGSLIVIGGLGQGSFADVVKVRNLETDKVYAMKVIAKKIVVSQKARERLSMELCAMTKMPRSPFLQRCYGAFESATNIFFVVDLNSGGDLFFHLSSRFSEKHGWHLSENEGRVILAELALAIEHMHENGYLHKDIKVENVMLDRSGHVKLVDFGLAEIMQAEVMYLEPTGSIVYMAPELLRYHTCGRHTDWWAYGILANELLTGCVPWSNFEDDRVIQNEIQSLVFRFPGHLSQPATQLLGGLLERDYKTRLGTISGREVRAAQFFRGIDWEATAQLKCAPAFVPSERSASSDAMLRAIASYVARSEVPGPGEFTWYHGLGRIATHPRYRAETSTLPYLGRP